MIFLSNYVIALLFINGILLILGLLAFIKSVQILLCYRPNLSNSYQFGLQNSSYLISTIISFILWVKILLFLFFIFTLDKIAIFIPGAMCATGVISATNYGVPLIEIKIIIVFLLIGWLYIQNEDNKDKYSKFLRVKLSMFIVIFLLLCVSFALEILHFINLRTDVVVQCCSVIFKPNSYEKLSLIHRNSFIIFMLFISQILNYSFGFLRLKFMFFLCGILNFITTGISIIRFYSPYIYELPSHKCPFCMLDEHYNYIGYVIIVLLFLANIPNIMALISKILKTNFNDFYYKFGIVMNLILLGILNFYLLRYLIINGVWL